MTKHRKLGGLMDTLSDWEREKDAAEALAAGCLVCVECGWGCDDTGLEICCDCFDTATFKKVLRGEFGKREQAEARASVNWQWQ